MARQTEQTRQTQPTTWRRTRLAAAPWLLATAALSTPAVSTSASTCSARSPRAAVAVIELYTSEGCSSCPAADRWLSRMKGRADVVALAFHVDYWDRLGWKDRFASAEFTRRQTRLQRSSGAGFSYTPQVIVGGADRKDWPSLRPPPTAALASAAPVELALQRDGVRFTATVLARADAPARLSAYWAVTEDGHASVVASGENRGATLTHDHVVRDYGQLPAWNSSASASPAILSFDVDAGRPDPAHPRSVSLVVVDADTGRPLQAVKLGC